VRTNRDRKVGVLETKGCTVVSESWAEWDSEPEVPVTVTFAVEAGVVAAADRNSCPPASGVKGAAEAVTPDGRLLAWTVIEDEKPLDAVAESETETEVPASTMMLGGVTVSAKSPVCFGAPF
jgi:hypothetical protein